MMQLGVRYKEGTEEVEDGYLTFDSGKKIILTAAEVKEFEDKIRMYKAEAKLKLEKQLQEQLEPLTLLLDWFNEAPVPEMEAVEDAIGFRFPLLELMNALHIIFKKDQRDLQKESNARIKEERNRK